MNTSGGISGFALKMAAIAGMTANHVAHTFADEIAGAGDWGAALLVALYGCGGLTFPIMAFLVSEGYAHTSNVRRYALRLGVFAVVAQGPYALLFGATGNVLFTLLIGLTVLWLNDNAVQRGVFWGGSLVLVLISAACDWGVIGPLMIYVFHALRGQGARGVWTAMIVPIAGVGLPALGDLMACFTGNTGAAGQVDGANSLLSGLLGNGGGAGRTSAGDNGLVGSLFGSPAKPSATADLARDPFNLSAFEPVGTAFMQAPLPVVAAGECAYAFVGFTLAAALLSAYRGRRGRPLKWFFYAYYPAHLLAIALIQIFVV